LYFFSLIQIGKIAIMQENYGFAIQKYQEALEYVTNLFINFYKIYFI